MASVFQRDGRRVAKFKDERGLWTTRSCGKADKATAQRWAAAWEAQARDAREGRTDPRADGYRQADARSIADHVSDFAAMLQARGNTPKHVLETAGAVRRVLDLSGAARLSDLSADAVQRAVAQIRDSGRSLRTANKALRAVKTFAGWLLADRRIRHDDLRHVRNFNAATDRRRVRRDLADEELARLIDAAERGPWSWGMSGEDRAMAYRLAAGTGFRRNELRSLTTASFRLDADPPCIAVTASYSKRRRDDVQPIDGALAAMLKTWLDSKTAGEVVLPLTDKTAAMLAADLRRARAWWIREATDRTERRERRGADFLAYIDSAGAVADFHGLRHRYVSAVVNSGASVKVAQELARHSTPTLTIGRYAHVRLVDLRRAVPSVPTIMEPAAQTQAQALRATGTDDSAPRRAPRAHQTGGDLARFHAIQCESGAMRIVSGDMQKTLDNAGRNEPMRLSAMTCESAPGRIRTSDRRIRNPMQPEVKPSKTAISEEARTTGAPNRTDLDPDVSKIVEAWPDLPPAIRAAVLALVNATPRNAPAGGDDPEHGPGCADASTGRQSPAAGAVDNLLTPRRGTVERPAMR